MNKMNKMIISDPNYQFCSECGNYVFIEKNLDKCWSCIKKDPKFLKKYKEWKKQGKFITWLGISLDYDTLRNWVKSPFTLERHELEAYRQFVKDHGKENSNFGWFFEVASAFVQISQSEIDCLLRDVDEMEITGSLEERKYTSKDDLYMENHLKYISRLFDKPNGLEFFEVCKNQRTGQAAKYITLIIDYYPEKEE